VRSLTGRGSDSDRVLRLLGRERAPARTFGHTGSTGTLCWADPASETVCVVLTSLPARAAKPHPRDVAAERVAAAALR
jgi:CubicO group peptidase (beta-lactamase class C family)